MGWSVQSYFNTEDALAPMCLPKPDNYSLLWAVAASLVRGGITNVMAGQQNVN